MVGLLNMFFDCGKEKFKAAVTQKQLRCSVRKNGGYRYCFLGFAECKYRSEHADS